MTEGNSMGEKKTILVLGGSIMQLPAVDIAHDMGWRVVVADANPNCPGRVHADEFAEVSLADLDGILKTARNLKEAGGLDGVFTAGTDFSGTVAYTAENMGLPGLSYETALDASDKSRMRAVFSREGVPSPRFISYYAQENPDFTRLDFKPPFVVKPVDNMGARGIKRVDTDDELKAAAAAAFEFSRSGKVIVEEYIEGPEFSLDALVYDGEIFLCGIADRHIFFPPYFVEMGHTMWSSFPEDVIGSVIDVFYRGIRALGINNGAAKGDIKLSPSGPVVGEIAARLSGDICRDGHIPWQAG